MCSGWQSVTVALGAGPLHFSVPWQNKYIYCAQQCDALCTAPRRAVSMWWSSVSQGMGPGPTISVTTEHERAALAMESTYLTSVLHVCMGGML